jgi:hypothetical protein
MSLVSRFLSHDERCTHHFTDANFMCVLSSLLVGPSYMSWKQNCNTLKQWIYTVGTLLFPCLLEGGCEATGSPSNITLLCFLDLKNSSSQQISSSPAHVIFETHVFQVYRICDVTIVSILCFSFVYYLHLNDTKNNKFYI